MVVPTWYQGYRWLYVRQRTAEGGPYTVSGLQVDVRVMTGARNAPLLLSTFCALISERDAVRFHPYLHYTCGRPMVVPTGYQGYRWMYVRQRTAEGGPYRVSGLQVDARVMTGCFLLSDF